MAAVLFFSLLGALFAINAVRGLLAGDAWDAWVYGVGAASWLTLAAIFSVKRINQ